MPRKQWEPKNPYCKRSKLSKNAFELLTLFYFYELTTGTNRHDCALGILACGGGSVTRQTVSSYFDKIGQFIWDNLVLPHNPIYKEELALNKLKSMIINKAETSSTLNQSDLYELTPKGIGSYPENTPIERTFLFHLLSHRSKIVKGISNGFFHLELSRIFFFCKTVHEKQRYNLDQYAHEYHFEPDVERVARDYLLQFIKESPL